MVPNAPNGFASDKIIEKKISQLSLNSQDGDQQSTLSQSSHDDLTEFELAAIDMCQTDKAVVAKQLMQQMQKVGFCLLTNVPGYDEEKLFSAIKAYHDLPLELKMKMGLKHHNPENSNIYAGYHPFLAGDVSHKEILDTMRPMGDFSDWERNGCSLYEETPWTNEFDSEYAWIRETFEGHFKTMHTLALTLIRCFAIGLGKRVDYFDAWFKDECASMLRGIHYKPRKFDEKSPLSAVERELVTPEHADSGFITLLSTFMYPGLEVEINGRYEAIKPEPNAIVVNVGLTLEAISDYRIKATYHRVRDIGKERYSSPFFMDPKFSARVSNDILQSTRTLCEDDDYDNDPANKEEVAKLVSCGQKICEGLYRFGEWKGFKTPDVNYDYDKKPDH